MKKDEALLYIYISKRLKPLNKKKGKKRKHGHEKKKLFSICIYIIYMKEKVIVNSFIVIPFLK